MGDYIEILREGEHAMRAYKAVPASGSGPVVVVMQEIFGVNLAMRAVADDLAANGFVALAPDLFWRIEPGIELGYDEASFVRARECWQAFDQDKGAADGAATIAAARKLPEGNGKVGVVGFCLGGNICVRAAAAEHADAVVSFYGVQLDKRRAEIEALAAPAQFHFGDADTHFSPEARETLEQVAAEKPEVELHVYPGAQHAFYNSFRAVSHDPNAEKQAHARMLAFFKSALG
jgi:carboxymethylenebutenolidase